MKKILIVSTVSRQFFLFERVNIEVLNSLGYEVHAAANFSDASERLDDLEIVRHHFDIERSPFSLKNLEAYKQLKKIIKNGNFDAIHCHSPMGGVLTRIAAKFVEGGPVIYTAHGFHFYKGAPLLNWLIYFPVEKILSYFTHTLITINEEDYSRAKKFNAEKVMYVPGIGIDTTKYSNLNINRVKKRNEIGIGDDKVVLLSIGEMIKRKNHETALRAISKLEAQNVIYIICGTGELENYLKDLAKTLGIEDKVLFLGYRNDIAEICLSADVFIFPSYQEGLPVSVMEAMSAGLPVICSSIRGNTDLIKDGGGYLLEPDNIEGFTTKMEKLINSTKLRKNMGDTNLRIVKKYDKKIIISEMSKLYGNL